MSIYDDAKALGYGAARGAAGIADFLGSVASYPFRKAYEAGNDVVEYIKGNKKQLKDSLDKKEKAGLLGQFSDLFGGVDVAQQQAQKAGLLNAPTNKREAYLQSIGEAVPGVFMGGVPGLTRKAVTAIGSGLGAQALGDAAKLIDPSYETLGRIGGSIVGGIPGITYNSPLMAQRTIKPNLNDEQIGIMKALEKKPEYAPYFADKIKSDDADLLKSLTDQINKASRARKDSGKQVQALLAKTPEVDTSPIVNFLQNHIKEVEGTAPGSGGESVKYAQDMIRRIQNQKSPLALHRLKQEVGAFTKDLNAPGVTKEGIARPLYGQISEVLDQSAPGYRDLTRQANEARQAQVLKTELDNSVALSKGDPAKALDRFSRRVIQNEIKNDLNDVTPAISDVLRKAEEFGTTYAERGGSGAKIAQNAAQAKAGKDFSLLDIAQAPNRIVGSVVNPIKNTKNFLSITEGPNPFKAPAIPAIAATQIEAQPVQPQVSQPQVQPSQPIDFTAPSLPEMDFERFLQLQEPKKQNANNNSANTDFNKFLALGTGS